MNNQPVVLELREQDTPEGLTTGTNGDWETILNQPVDINDGDSIMIQQTFLDTVAFPEGTITIPNDLTLRVQNYVYNNKWLGAGLGAQNTPNIYGQYTEGWTAAAPGGSAIEIENGNPFILCNALDRGEDNAAFLFAPYFRVSAIGNRSGFNTKFGGYTITLKYQGIGQDEEQYTYLNLQLPKLDNVKGLYYDFVVNITYRHSKDIVVSSPSKDKIQRNGGRTSFPDKGQPLPDAKAWHPRIFTRLYPLPAGQYTPGQLCKKINTLFQQNYGAGAVQRDEVSKGPWNTSQFFVSSDGQASDEGVKFGATDFNTATLMNMEVVAPGAVGQGYQHIASYPKGATNSTKPPDTARNVWIGANQVELSYDEDSQKFFWEQLHTPIYQNNEEAVGIRYSLPPVADPVIEQGTNEGSFHMLYSNGGIMFASLTAFEGIASEADQNYVPFWEETLKFNLAQLYGPRYEMSAAITTPTGFTGDIKPQWRFSAQAQLSQPEALTVGVGMTMTGGFIGNDNAMLKAGDLTSDTATKQAEFTPFFANNPVRIFTDGTAMPTALAADQMISSNNPLFSTPTANYTLEAADRMFKTSDIRSHYLVEIDAKLQNNFLTGKTNIRSMSQVVGKFYSRGSFTQSGGAGFVYTHTGPSLKLSSFKVRILFPDKTIATDIGNDNTVYMSIIRNPNARQIEAQQLQDFVKESRTSPKVV